MNTTNKRTPLQIEYDRAEIARRYLKGELQSVIAESLGMTQQMVSYDLQRIKEQWRQSALVDFNEIQVKELAKIDTVEREYWNAWDRSCSEKQRTKTERKTGGVMVVEDGTKQVVPIEEKATVQKEQRDGNPVFLAGVMTCIEQRCKIFGLYSPDRLIIDWRKEAEDKGLDVTSEYERLVKRFTVALQSSNGEDGSGRVAGGETAGSTE